MRTLTAYMSDAGKICPMVLLIDGELKRNADEAAVSPDLTEGEKDRLREWIENAHVLCAEVLESHPTADSVRGATVRKKVYRALRSDVDVISRGSDDCFENTEIKYAIKPYSYGPFSQAEYFISQIAVKFDQLEREMRQDTEVFDPLRAILVSDDHFNILQTAITDLSNTQEVLSSDGARHEYLLCTLGGLIGYRRGNSLVEGVSRFVL